MPFAWQEFGIRIGDVHVGEYHICVKSSTAISNTDCLFIVYNDFVYFCIEYKFNALFNCQYFDFFSNLNHSVFWKVCSVI